MELVEFMSNKECVVETLFTEALSADMHIPISALIQVVKGGNICYMV